MRKLITYFSFLLIPVFFNGCSDRRRVTNSDYVVVHPQSWNPDGHPGIFLYYKGKPLWFNVYCPDYGYHDGILVFEGDIPDSLFNGSPVGNESADFARSLQLFAVRKDGPPVIISERILRKSLGSSLFRVQHFESVTNGLDVNFKFANSETKPTNVIVSWPEIKKWLDDSEATTPIKTSRMGRYRYLPMQP